MESMINFSAIKTKTKAYRSSQFNSFSQRQFLAAILVRRINATAAREELLCDVQVLRGSCNINVLYAHLHDKNIVDGR